MQYIDQNTTPRTNIKRQDDLTTLEREWTNYNRHATHNHNSKDLEYDLTSQKRTSLN